MVVTNVSTNFFAVQRISGSSISGLSASTLDRCRLGSILSRAGSRLSSGTQIGNDQRNTLGSTGGQERTADSNTAQFGSSCGLRIK